MGSVPLARVVRSGVVESVHLGDVAVCDGSGRLLAAVGDPDRVAFARSCMKPIQAAVSLGAIDTPVPDAEIAVMCASHNGEPIHVRTVRRLLRRGGLDDAALRNPAGRPMDPDAAARVRVPAPVFHDCSGNHAGMLVASALAGWPIDTYRSRSHPHHRRVLPLVRALAGADPIVGVDGCGIPVHGLSLRALATMYARLGAASTDHAEMLARATGAMRTEPYLVGGRARDDTAIMQATPDLVVKQGAEALTCAVSLPASIGIAVKIADGGYRAVGPATIEVLDQLGLLTPGARRRLRPFLRPRVMGGGRPVGHLEAVCTLSPERA
jgi:L-asparaginase II